jgi:hypothetical protein
MEIFLMTSAKKPERGRPHRKWPFDYKATVSNFLDQALNLRKAKKRLIATHANSEIAATYSKHTTSLFLTATQNLILELPFFTLHGPCLADRNRPRRFKTRSNHSKQLPGDASNHHKMRKLHTRHQSSREAQ